MKKLIILLSLASCSRGNDFLIGRIKELEIRNQDLEKQIAEEAVTLSLAWKERDEQNAMANKCMRDLGQFVVQSCSIKFNHIKMR